jgi:hypothetical protein
MDFYPDYTMGPRGPRWIPDRSRVFLLHVTSGVHLVLIEKGFFALRSDQKIGRLVAGAFKTTYFPSLISYDTSGKAKNLDKIEFVRIGVMRSPRVEEDKTHWPTRWAEHIELV